MKGSTTKKCAIIPAYNEAETIGWVVQETKKHVDKVFVIDDASTDGTAQIAQQNGAEIVKHVINRGIGAAQQTGYHVALSEGFDCIVQLDGDGQHDPRFIPQLVEAINGCDMVIGSRYLNESYKKYHLVRRIGISFFTSVINVLTPTNITDVTSGYRVYKSHIFNELDPQFDRHWAVAQTLECAQKGLKIKEVSVEMPPRKNGESQLNPQRFAMYPFRMIEIILRVILFRRG